MLSIRENLGTEEAAKAYNQRIYDYRCAAVGHPGCIRALACVHCYRLISDSVCLCIGCFTCPNCGKENGTRITYTPATANQWSNVFLTGAPSEVTLSPQDWSGMHI